MPTLINGCGTWYCGKRRIHRVKTPCAQCGAFAELESYDTTLCFVVFMIPVVPLGDKRILNSCPVCQRHQIVKLKDWEAGKAQAFNAILEKLKANPDDRETIQTALGLATVYQDEALFDKLADALAGHRTDDAEIQAQLGAAYEYFSRWPDAEAAYRRSHAVQDSEDTRERLAVTLLKQDRPEEAAKYVQHVFESADKDKAWLIFWLVEGFMARGMHDEALRVMDVRDELYPKLARTKDYEKQRKTAEKHKASGKPIKSVYLAESAKTGFREGSRFGFRWPKYVAAAVVLGLLAIYLGVCIHRGQNRPVYLVNGWTKPYTVTVNGEQHQLQPGTHKRIEVSEGDVTVEWPDGPDGPQTVRVATGFFGRPFDQPVFVINPDRVALVERDETVYSANPVDPKNPTQFRTGQLLHRFEEVDYEFEEFPPQIQAKAGAQITKTRVGMITAGDPAGRLFRAMATLPPDQWPAYMKRLVQLDPNDGFTLTFLTATLPPPEAVEFLKPGLAARPLRVEWHREYHRLMEVLEPNRDLRPEYRQLVEETKRAPDALYLLGRLEEGRAADALYLEAAVANPPSAHACAGLGARFMTRGDFDNALVWAVKAHTLDPANPMYRQWYVRSLLAAGKWPELLKATEQPTGGEVVFYLPARLTALVATGERRAAEAEVERAAGRPFGGNLAPAAVQAMAQTRLGLQQTLAEVLRDRAKWLELAGQLTSKDQFTEALLRGDHKAAASAVEPAAPAPINATRDWELEASRAGLLTLAGLKAKDAGFADEQFKKMLVALGRGDREGRLYAAMAEGKLPFDTARARDAAMIPTVKRVVLMALARKFPQHAKELEPLAKKLDFERDETSLCLRYLTE